MSRIAAYGRNVPVSTSHAGFRLFEAIFFAFVLMYSSGILIQVLFLGNDPTVRLEDHPARGTLQMIWAVVYLVLIGLIVSFRNELYGSVRQQPVVIALSLYILASVIWSSAPDVTLQNAVVLGLGTVIGAYIGTRFSTEQIFYLMKYPVLIGMVSSIFLVVFVPDLGLMKTTVHNGLWKGAYVHKNVTGLAALIAIVVFLYCYRANIYVMSALVACATIVLIGARSSTSFIALAVLAGIYIARRPLSVRGLDVFLVICGGLLLSSMIAFVLILNLEAFVGLFGKDLTFTGRTFLWEYGFRAFLSRPLLGFGFDAFWYDTSQYGGVAIRALAGWQTPGIHNGWLELLLSVGLVGTVLFASIFFGLMQRTYYLLRLYPLSEYLYVLMFCVLLLVYSIAEGVFLLRNSVVHVLVIAFVFSTYRELLEARISERAASE